MIKAAEINICAEKTTKSRMEETTSFFLLPPSDHCHKPYSGRIPLLKFAQITLNVCL